MRVILFAKTATKLAANTKSDADGFAFTFLLPYKFVTVKSCFLDHYHMHQLFFGDTFSFHLSSWLILSMTMSSLFNIVTNSINFSYTLY